MIRSFRNILSGRLAVALLCAASVVSGFQSCIKDDLGALVENPMETPLPFVFDTFTEEGEYVGTRSCLTVSDIETKKTCITLAAYTDEKLYSVKHFTSGLTSMTMPLLAGKTFNVYALVNMGDMSSEFPFSESSVRRIKYDIPSYTSGSSSIAARGIPMAGSITGLSITSSTSGTKTIPVTRLLAKVTANLSCNWDAVITNAYVKNLNRYVKPFGFADGAVDCLSEYEIALPSGSNASSFLQAVFYVPENGISSQLGTADDWISIDSSHDKRLDNDDVAFYLDIFSYSATYLEVNVTGGGDYSGSVTYRSILGGNSTTDFDVLRNTHYVWDISYNEDGLHYDDWKVENNLSGERYVYYLYDGTSSSSNRLSSVNVGVSEYKNLYVYRFRQTFSSGTWTEVSSSKTLIPYRSGSNYYLRFNDGTKNNQNISGHLTDGGTGNVLNVYGQSENIRCRGVNKGTADLVIYIDDSTAGGTSVLTVPVYVGDYVTYRIPSVTRVIAVGESFQLNPRLAKYVNDSFDSYVSGVTFTYNSVTNSYYSVNGSGLVTGLAYSNNGYIYESNAVSCVYSGTTYYGGVLVMVNNTDITYTYENLIVSPSSAAVVVGQSQAYTASCTRKSWQNGSVVSTETIDVTGSSAWSIASGSAYASLNSNVATGTAAGTATIRATYSGLSATATLTVGSNVSYQYRLTLSPAETSICVGDHVTFEAYLHKDKYENGTLVMEDYEVSLVSSSMLDWVIANVTYLDYTGTSGEFVGLSQGATTVTAYYNSGNLGAPAGDVHVSASAVVTVNSAVIPVTGVSLNNSSVNILEGQTCQLTATVSPSDASNPAVTWTSSNSSVATVDQNGLVTGVARGSVTITATADGVSAQCTVNVSKLWLDPASATTTVGNSVVFTAKITAYSGSVVNVTGSVNWSVVSGSAFEYNPEVSLGGFDAIAAGSSVIKATYNGTYGQGFVTGTATATVGSHTFEITPASAAVNVGEAVIFQAKFDGNLLTASSVTWNWSISGIAVIGIANPSSYNAVATGLSEGEVTLTATYTYYGQTYTATATLTVFDDINVDPDPGGNGGNENGSF